MLSALEAVGFTRFSINPNYGNIIAQIDFNFGGIEVEVSYAEQADLRVIVGDNNCIWKDEIFDILNYPHSLETFARNAVAEWTRMEFKEVDHEGD